MPQKSFSALIERADPEPNMDCIAAVFNTAAPASGKVIGIKAVRVSFASPHGEDMSAPWGCQGAFSIDRITAYVGGTEVSPVKHDTSAGSLPSQVKVMVFPDSVTNGDKFRQVGDAVSSFQVGTAVSFQAMMRAPGVCDANEGGRCIESHNVIHKMWDSDTESIVLREGEGIACNKRWFGTPQAHHWNIYIRDSSSGNTYRWLLENAGSPYGVNDPIWCLYNASGSGLVLQVYVVSHVDFGEPNQPRLRFIRTGANPTTIGGTEVTMAKHDTAATITDVKIVKGAVFLYPLVATQGVNISYLSYTITLATEMLWQHKADCFRVFGTATPIYNVTMSPQLRVENDSERWPGDRRGAGAIDDDIIINPGEGFAVVGMIRNEAGLFLPECSELAFYNVEIECYQATPDAVFPIENDVRNGVDYGPTGAEYDGDLVLPVIGDVKLGVGYGADGTEYTGTYSGGGGGDTVTGSRFNRGFN